MRKDEQINVRKLRPEVLREAKAQAARQGKSLSEVIREFLEKFAKDDPKKQPGK